MHSAPFGCLTKLGAKHAELVQKFVPRCHVRIFRTERTRSTSLDPKLKILLCYNTQFKMGQTGAKVRSSKSRRNFSQRTHPIHPFDPNLTFCYVSYYLGAFGTVWLPYETQCKTCRTSAKVRATKSRQNFLQRLHPIYLIGT